MADSPVFILIYCVHIILWWIFLKYQRFYWGCLLGHLFLLVLIVNGYTRRLTVGLDQVQLVFLVEASHKFDLWPSILALEENFLLSEAKKH